jgi:hypothetical protein
MEAHEPQIGRAEPRIRFELTGDQAIDRSKEESQVAAEREWKKD